MRFSLPMNAFFRRNASLGGVALVLVSTVAWSLGGLFTRMMTVDVWTAMTYKPLLGGLMLFATMAILHGRAMPSRVLGLRRRDWWAVLLNVVAQASTVAGLFMTSVAHVTVIYATCPFVAALAARVWIGEALSTRTLSAIVVSLVGVALAVSTGDDVSTWQGDLVAVIMTVSFSFIIVMSRAFRDLPSTEIAAVSSVVTFLLFLPFSAFRAVDPWNLTILVVYSFAGTVLGYLVFVQGARLVSAASSGLIVTLEIVLSPFWVWLCFDERIGPATLAGGALVVLATVWNIAGSMRAAPALPLATSAEEI